jgi:hypothetical protein
MEQALQDVLLGWPDDAQVLASPLLDRLTTRLPGAAERENADRLRLAIRTAIERATEQAVHDDALAYRAISLAYVERATSHDIAARQLAVSRSTFYRLLRRGVQALARALSAP